MAILSLLPTLQLLNQTLVFSIVTDTNPNFYLLVLAALGWAVSLYFGFFRYRQYVWSRNKVRFDLMQKIDQRRADVAAKLLMFCEISTDANPRKARIKSLLRKYFSLLRQIDFYHKQGVFDPVILEHLQNVVSNDLRAIRGYDQELDVQLQEWLHAATTPGNFFSTLTFEQQH